MMLIKLVQILEIMSGKCFSLQKRLFEAVDYVYSSYAMFLSIGTFFLSTDSNPVYKGMKCQAKV